MTLLLLHSAAHAFNLPDTGQTGSYTAGDDGEYNINPMSYTDNGNTVTDNNTGLMWQKCNAGQNDETNCIENATTYSWSNAFGYCNGLTLPLGGKSDWRLPNVKELESLTDDATYNVAIDTAFFLHSCSSWYWSSTTGVGSAGKAWYVSFYGGSVGDYSNSRLQCVRCVRGGQGESSYVKLMTGGNPFYNIQDAYNNAQAGDIILTKAVVSTENQTFVASKVVSLKGGYNNDFTSVIGFTTVNGNLTIIGGTLTIENLIIQ